MDVHELPFCMSAGISFNNIFDGIAKPTPEYTPVFENMAVFIPTTSPFILSKGPPELPGLISASVCIVFEIEYPVTSLGNRRPIWLITPVVSVPAQAKRITNCDYLFSYLYL